MKSIIKNIALFGIIVAGMSSCQDLLTEKPSSYLTTEDLFTDLSGAQMALNDVYAAISLPDHYGQFEMAMPTSDDMYYISGTGADRNRRDISHYQYTTNNEWVETLWKYKYIGIDRANQVIENLPLIKEYTEQNLEALRIEGQARFMRALLAFDIVRYWGDAPFKTDYTDEYAQAYQPKASRDSIYNQIVRDLNIAKTQLGWAKAGSNPERPTQGSARALLMRVYLHRAGYYFPSTSSIGGDLVRTDETTRQEYFTKVKEEYEAFVANGFHDLSPLGYRGYWMSFCQKKPEPVESLFEIGFYSPDGKKAGGSNWGTYIGPLTHEKSKYGRANAFFNVIPAWFTKYYEEKDNRKLTNICYYEIGIDGDSIPYPYEWQPGKKRNVYYPGKWRREWMTNPVKDPNNVDVNFVYLRYADVLLMAAEAYNELNDPATAQELINRVRRRAKATEWTDDATYKANYVTGKLAAVKELIPDNDAQGKVRRALYWERGFELCYEGTRKYDLLRWGVLEGAIRATSNGKAYIANTNFTKGKHELFPIPLSEIQANPKITSNNPGFN